MLFYMWQTGRKKRVGAWEHLLKARAIENLSFVFGLNRIGTDGNNLFYQESSHCFLRMAGKFQRRMEILYLQRWI